MEYKCHFCDICDGRGCINELPGMGGIQDNKIFQANYDTWRKYKPVGDGSAEVRLAPISGGVENIGYTTEAKFYMDYIWTGIISKARLSIGDGFPDHKLQYGIDALDYFGVKGAVFLKPRTNGIIFNKIKQCVSVATHIGIDMDSFQITTMRNKCFLEQKTVGDLCRIKDAVHKYGIPFILKGVYTETDIELISAVKPDIIVVSNHGGRVNRGQSYGTIDFLSSHQKQLIGKSWRVWIDGGVRCVGDCRIARDWGADEVLVGRPFISNGLRRAEMS